LDSIGAVIFFCKLSKLFSLNPDGGNIGLPFSSSMPTRI
jgi:hypothetical protein